MIDIYPTSLAIIYGGFAQNVDVLNDFMKLGDMLFIDQQAKASSDVLLPLTITNHGYITGFQHLHPWKNLFRK